MFESDATENLLDNLSTAVLVLDKSLIVQYANHAAQALFDDLDAVDIYDGIWASFSLLHAPREKLPQHLGQIKRAIKARGVFHIGMKLGDSSSRDTLGRAYTYVSEGELLGLLTEAGLKPYDIFKGEGAGLSGSVDKFILVRAHG